MQIGTSWVLVAAGDTEDAEEAKDLHCLVDFFVHTVMESQSLSCGWFTVNLVSKPSTVLPWL